MRVSIIRYATQSLYSAKEAWLAGITLSLQLSQERLSEGMIG